MTTTTPPAATTSIGRQKQYAVDSRDWRADAACAQVDPELFFPSGYSKKARKQAAQAKAVCMGCPVRRRCLEWALDTGQWMGVAGGMDEDERWRLRGGSGAPSRSAFDRALNAREFIEEQLALGASVRSIGSQLGVDHHVVTRARDYYLKQDTEPQEASA